VGSGLDENELLGIAWAARKVAAWAAWAETLVEAEYTSRNMEWDSREQRETLGEFAHEEVAQDVPLSGGAARAKLERSKASRDRLGRCLALQNAGVIDSYRMRIIAEVTANVDDALIAKADKLIADQAPRRTPLSLRRLCTRVVMATDPEAVERNRKGATKTRRVEIGQEYSGNGYASLREISVADALAIKQNLQNWARRMRRAGLAGTLENLRADAAAALLLERRPIAGPVPARGDEGLWDGIEPTDQDPAEAAEDEDAASYDPWDFRDTGTGEGAEPLDNGTTTGPAANITILVSAATMDGTSGAPAEIPGFGFTGADATRAMLAAASRNPATRWCVTVVNPRDGTAVGHACARGQHPWTPPPTGPPATGPPGAGIGGFLASLKLKFEPIARETCDHTHRERQHDPSRALSHLIRARNSTCSTPGCGAAAVTADLDHTIPYEMGGPTDECNVGPRCRHHHRTKQHPKWRVEQLTPDVTRWTGPSGRAWFVHPTRYQL